MKTIHYQYKVKSDTVDSPYWEEMNIEIYDSTNPKCKFTVGKVWYGNSLFDITEKYIVIAKYLIKNMIYVWRLHKEYTGCSLPCSH